jgi:hypothetical protein
MAVVRRPPSFHSMLGPSNPPTPAIPPHPSAAVGPLAASLLRARAASESCLPACLVVDFCCRWQCVDFIFRIRKLPNKTYHYIGI